MKEGVASLIQTNYVSAMRNVRNLVTVAMITKKSVVREFSLSGLSSSSFSDGIFQTFLKMYLFCSGFM